MWMTAGSADSPCDTWLAKVNLFSSLIYLVDECEHIRCRNIDEVA